MAQDASEAALEAELDKELVDEPVVDSAPETAAEPESSPPSGLAALLRANGWEVEPDTTDEEAVAYIREQEAAAQKAQQLEERTRQLEAWYAASQQPKPVETPPEPKTPVAEAPAKPKREVPEFDPEWESLLKLDENGQLVTVAPWVDPAIPGKYQKAIKWQKAEQARLLREPGALLRESGYEDELKSTLLTPYEQRLAALEKQIADQRTERLVSERDQFLVSNSHFYAEVGEDGQPVLDAQGLLKPNANYQRFVDYEAALEKAGIADPAKRLELAIKAVPPTAPAQQTTAPVPEPATKRTAIRNRVNDRIRANGTKIAQPPVRTQRGGAAEIVERPASIGQLKNRWVGMLEQAVGGDE